MNDKTTHFSDGHSTIASVITLVLSSIGECFNSFTNVISFNNSTFVDKDQVRYIAQVSTYLFLGGAYAASAP